MSVLYFRNPLTLTGALGSTIAIIGVLLYSLAKAHYPPPPQQVQLQAPAPQPIRPPPPSSVAAVVSGRRRPKRRHS